MRIEKQCVYSSIRNSAHYIYQQKWKELSVNKDKMFLTIFTMIDKMGKWAVINIQLKVKCICHIILLIFAFPQYTKLYKKETIVVRL